MNAEGFARAFASAAAERFPPAANGVSAACVASAAGDMPAAGGASATRGPVFSWVWNTHVDEDGIKTRLREIASLGARAFYVIPEPAGFRPASMITELSPPYLSDEYLRLLRFARDEGAALGLEMWLYDEGGWPSGHACGLVAALDPAFGECRLRRAERGAPLPSGAKAVGSDDKYVYFTLRAKAPRALSESDIADGVDVPCVRADILSERAADAFVRLQYDRCLDAAPAPFVFTDEPVAAMPALPVGIFGLFLEKYGYALEDKLAALFGDEIGGGAGDGVSGVSAGSDSGRSHAGGESADADGEGNHAGGESAERHGTIDGARVRVDYGVLIGELFRERFLMRCRGAAHAHGARFTGHLDRDHSPYACAQLGYGSAPACLRCFDVPGADVITRQITPRGSVEDTGARLRRGSCKNGDAFFFRMMSGAAAANTSGDVLSEVFAVYGAGLTWDEMRYVMCFQLARGVTLFNFMLCSYGKSGALAYTERPSFSPDRPGGGHMRAVCDFAARASAAMTSGVPDTRAALYVPSRDILAGGGAAKSAVEAYERAGMALERLGVQFDIIDDEFVADADARGGALTLGRAAYEAVVVPDCAYMSAQCREKLAPFAVRGDDIERKVTRLRGATAVAGDGGECESPCTWRLLRGDGFDLFFCFNEDGGDGEYAFEVATAHARAHIADASDGTVRAIPSERRGAAQLVRLKLAEGGCAFVVFADADLSNAPPKPVARGDVALYGVEAAPLARYRLTPDGMVREALDAPFAPVCREPDGARGGDGNGCDSGDSCFGGDYHTESVNVGGNYALLDFERDYGVDFSGEVALRARFTLPDGASGVRITLRALQCGASVSLNGVYAGEIVFAPWSLDVCGAPLRAGENELCLVISNTAANEFARSDNEKQFTEAQLGTYHRRTQAYELSAPPGGVREIVVERL